MKTDELEAAGKILNALRLLSQLLHPDDTSPVISVWREEISDAIVLQEAIYSKLQKTA